MCRRKFGYECTAVLKYKLPYKDKAARLWISENDYVEAQATGQWGTVEKVIANKDGVPVCVRVRCELFSKDSDEVVESCTDYIECSLITLHEPYTYRGISYADIAAILAQEDDYE